MRPNSIRQQLLRWLLSPILGTVILSLFSSYYLALSFANNALDLELEENARALVGQVVFENAHWTLASPELSLAAFRHHNQERDIVYYLITDAAGNYVGGDKRLGGPSEVNQFSSFANKSIDNTPLRVVTLKVPVKNGSRTTEMFIQMAETLSERTTLANQILVNTMAHQLALALLVILCVWLGVSRGLIPLEKLKNDIMKRTATDLSPLNEQTTPEEVRPLIHATNGLMQRLEEHIGLQQRFIANAAHQLRTPLAGLQTQLEVALREDNPQAHQHALNQMQVSLERSIRLAQQLLSLAKAEPQALHTECLDRVNLSALISETLELFATIALQKPIDLSLEAPETAIFIEGHTVSLMDLVSNLVENALIYTPINGKVTVRLAENDNQVKLEVEDNGLGIPVEERNKVFERFYRIQNNTDIKGSGLGLAIVQEVAKTHNATITLSEGKNGIGTLVQISFPKADTGMN